MVWFVISVPEEKSFSKDSSIKRIDVDLAKEVLLAYSNGVEIDFNDIKKKILQMDKMQQV